MVRDEVRWRNQRPKALNWVAAAFAGVLAVLHVGAWFRTMEGEPLVLAVFLVVWLGVYFTRYWQPVLYLLAAVVLGSSVAIDLLTTLPDEPFPSLVLGTTAAFVVSALYLFVSEEHYT
ncbi:hypothetical protein G9C85_13950 [Halorubellus sp. JP-L1]|uniref:hypothetical protein n=1 Tax=Halorubellus sp. JP-L1 TaxID=2715753 RepID=UPI00140AC254|nr:hypothetical protein [Halorubellus sp. JP-L1]NHN42725.1 hypothetical protein [Halorubellus sp. JP-L1]